MYVHGAVLIRPPDFPGACQCLVFLVPFPAWVVVVVVMAVVVVFLLFFFFLACGSDLTAGPPVGPPCHWGGSRGTHLEPRVWQALAPPWGSGWPALG